MGPSGADTSTSDERLGLCTQADDVATVAAAARAARDGAVRNAALATLGAIARQAPQLTLQHVLEVKSKFTNAGLCIAATSTPTLLPTGRWCRQFCNPSSIFFKRSVAGKEHLGTCL